MSANFTEMNFYLNFVAIVVGGGAYIYARVLARAKASNNSIDVLKERHGKRLGRHADRLTKMETVMNSMPKHTDLEKLHARVSAVKDDVSKLLAGQSGLASSVEGMAKSVDLLTEYHLKEGNDK